MLVLLLSLVLLAPLGCTKDDGDTCDTGCTQEDSAIPDDSDSPLDTEDTGQPPDPCDPPIATFTDEGGASQNLTDALTAGTYTTLDVPGRLSVCPGTWYTRLLLRADIEVVGLGSVREETILSGGESGTILDVAGPDTSIHVENVTLDRGAGLDTDHNSGGGGIYCEENASVSVDNAVFSNGFANDGAAIYTRDCSLEVRDTVFRDNLAEDDGGAVSLWYSTGDFEGVAFEDNQALDGGALAAFYSDLSVRNASFARNTSAYFAGGIWIYESTLDLVDSVLSQNINTGEDGGGMLLHGQASLSGVTLSENAARRGGGVFVYYEAEVTGAHCDFAGNLEDDLFVADYSKEGGMPYTLGKDVSFTCAGNVCETD